MTVSAGGDCGKPRPAVVVQSDAFPPTHASVIVCQMTSDLVNAPDIRIEVAASPSNGLRIPSQIMTDKPVTVRRSRIGSTIGRLSPGDMRRLDAALAFVLGLGG